MKEARSAAIPATWKETTSDCHKCVTEIFAANPFLLPIANALLHNGDHLLVLLAVDAKLLEVVNDSCKVGTGVLPDTLLHLALLDRRLDHLRDGERDQVEQEELGGYDGFHGWNRNETLLQLAALADSKPVYRVLGKGIAPSIWLA